MHQNYLQITGRPQTNCLQLKLFSSMFKLYINFILASHCFRHIRDIVFFRWNEKKGLEFRSLVDTIIMVIELRGWHRLMEVKSKKLRKCWGLPPRHWRVSAVFFVTHSYHIRAIPREFTRKFNISQSSWGVCVHAISNFESRILALSSQFRVTDCASIVIFSFPLNFGAIDLPHS